MKFRTLRRGEISAYHGEPFPVRTPFGCTIGTELKKKLRFPYTNNQWIPRHVGLIQAEYSDAYETGVLVGSIRKRGGTSGLGSTKLFIGTCWWRGRQITSTAPSTTSASTIARFTAAEVKQLYHLGTVILRPN